MEYYQCSESVVCYTSNGSFPFTINECYHVFREGNLMVVKYGTMELRMTDDDYVTHFLQNTTVFLKISKELYKKYLDCKRFDL